MGSQSEEAMELNAGWLESLLKRKAFEESPTRVVDFNIADGVGKWENYLSKIKRVSAKVALGSGRTRTVSLIIKDQHRTVYLKNMSQNNGYFFREIMMYRDIIPKMDDLLDEMKDDEGPLWAKCLGYRLYDQLVFEDLSASGHVVADRKQLMDLETSKFVVKSIARFHALSKVLLQRGEIPLDVFSESVWCKSETLERMIPKYTSNLVKAMETWGHEWKDAKERLAVSPQDVIEKFKKALKPEPTDFSVLTHGDCWTNNFLIRYDKESKEPRAMKFVDLQISSVAPCTYDLHYFLVTSVKPEVQQEHEELLLRCYSDSLKSNLVKFGFEGPIPALAEVQATMDKTAVFRLVTSLLITPIVTGIHDDVPDLEEIIAEQVEAMAKGEPAPERWNVHEYKNEITKNLVQNSIKLAVKLNVI